MAAPGADSALLVAARQLADEARERRRSPSRPRRTTGPEREAPRPSDEAG
jgi:hypothetical protein